MTAEDIGKKVRYVLGQTQTRQHRCHWPGCGEQVPPARWGCRTHWYALDTGTMPGGLTHHVVLNRVRP